MEIVIFDFDGTVIPPSKAEKLCRRIIAIFGISHPPKIFLALSEAIDLIRFLFFKKARQIRENRIASFLRQKELPVGILTDRSKCSLCLYLKFMEVDMRNLLFIQARKSFFDFFSPCDCNISQSPKIKPDPSVYENLVILVKKIGLDRREIVIVEDLQEARETAVKIGFSVVDPNEFLNLFDKPESNSV